MEKKYAIIIGIIGITGFIIIPNPITAQVQDCSQYGSCPPPPYVVAHWGLTACTDLGTYYSPITEICQRLDITIQQNDKVIQQNAEILSNMTYQEQLQKYQLCMTALAPASGSLPANYLATHGIDCSLPKSSGFGKG